MDLMLPITIADELSEDVIASKGQLNVASGDIVNVVYEDWDVAEDGLPCRQDDYEFTCGTLTSNGRDVEFRIDVNKMSGQYSVSPSELLELKSRAAALFAAAPGKR